MQTAEGREDLGIEVGWHDNLTVRDPFGYPRSQGRIDQIVDHRRGVDD
jgi:hypothetical protein